MVIGSSTVMMKSSRSYSETTAAKRVSATNLKGEEVQFDFKSGKSMFEQLRLANAEKEKSAQMAEKSDRMDGIETTPIGFKSIKSIRELKMTLLEKMLDALHRKKSGVIGQMYDSQTGFHLDMPELKGENVGRVKNTFVKQTVQSFFYREEENTAFCSQGKVTTADGRVIEFDISFEMSRSFEMQFETYSEQSYVLCDPLVFNFEGNVAEITDQKFLFDLDADGNEEEIGMLNAGSGFLALDKNGDGIINDGSELFGAKSGNGFKDLEEYDADKNGWIDEADEIFSKLKIWMKNEDGGDELLSLKEAGIGAICLENLATDFSEKNSQNEMLGIIRKTGLFLYENGGAGTAQQVDFAI